MGRRKVGKLARLFRHSKKDQAIHDFVSTRPPTTPKRGDKERVIEAAADKFHTGRREIQRSLARWEKGIEPRAALAKTREAMGPTFRTLDSDLAETGRAICDTFDFVRQWMSEEEIQVVIRGGGDMPLLRRIAEDRKELAELKARGRYHRSRTAVSGRKSAVKSPRRISHR